MKKLKSVLVFLLILPVFALTGCFAVPENHDYDTQNQLVTQSAQSNNILSHFLDDRFENQTPQTQNVYTTVKNAISQTNTYFSMFLMMNFMIETYERTGVTTTLRKDGEVYRYQNGNEAKLTLSRTQEKFVMDIVTSDQAEQFTIDFSSDIKNYEAKLTRGDEIVLVIDVFSLENGYALQISISGDEMYSVSQVKYTAGEGEIESFNLFVYESQVLPESIIGGIADNFAGGQGSVSYKK